VEKRPRTATSDRTCTTVNDTTLTWTVVGVFIALVAGVAVYVVGRVVRKRQLERKVLRQLERILQRCLLVDVEGGGGGGDGGTGGAAFEDPLVLSDALFCTIDLERFDAIQVLIHAGADASIRDRVTGMLPHAALLHKIEQVGGGAGAGVARSPNPDWEEEDGFLAALALFQQHCEFDRQLVRTLHTSKTTVNDHDSGAKAEVSENGLVRTP
jgi:hypothetical protein